jgi:tetratricopeptide (TPR) repeat protein
LLLSRVSELAWAEKLTTLAWQRGDDREDALRAATMVSFQLGRDEATVQAAQEWAKLVPDEVLAWQYLAYVAEDRGFWGDAIVALRNQISRTQGSQAEPRRRLVTYLIQIGESAEARREFALLKQDSEDDKKHETSLVEARLLFLEGKLDAAEQRLGQIDLTAVAPIEVTLLRARILTEKSEFAKAIPLLRECIAKAPANQDAYYLLGRVLARSGNVTEAQPLMKTHRHLVDTKARINSLERQAGHEPHNVGVRQSLSKIYEEIGLTEQAKFWQSAVHAAEQGHSQ